MRTQTIQAPMHVVQSSGDVMVVLADGSTRPVHQGEVLPAGTVLQLADNATVQLEPPTAAAQPEMMVPAAEAQGIPATGTTAEIAAIQQALLQGIDPTLNLEATAAGGAPAAGGGGAGGSGNGGFVSIDRTGDETLATAGFDTNYQSSLLAEPPQPFAAEEAVVVIPPPVIAPDPAALSETNLTTEGLVDVDLVNGSAPGEAPTTLTGNLNVDFGGGSGSVTFLPIDSQPVLSSGGQPIVWTLSADGQTLVGSVGGEVILSVTLAADGSSYTVDLDGPLDHGVGSLQMSFGIQAINLAGESAVGQIGLTIADDEPLATDNSSSLSEDSLQVEGNVLLDDRQGADGAAVTPVDLEDTYGRLTMDASGQYVYTLNTQDPVVQALDAGESLVREFTYTLTDGDGDVSTAILTITITGSNDIPTIEAHGEGLGVSETGLPEGSGVDADAQASGSFSIGDSDGLDDIKTLTIAGTTLNVAAGQTVADLVGSVVNTPYGQLTLDSFDADTGTFGYTYQLLNNVDNDSQPGADTNGFTETISLSVSDGANSADTSFGVYIADDTVNAEDDGPFTVTEDAGEGQLSAISGNVLDNDLHANGEPGADDRSFAGWTTPPSILTQYGTLVLGSDGSYSFELDDSLPATQGLSSQDVISETFYYDITDSDGDTDTASLTIRIQGTNDVVVINDLDGNEVAVSDANLPDGSAEDASLLTVDKSFTFSAPDGVKSLMVGDVELIHDGVVTTLPVSVTSGLGNSLVITGVVFDPATGAGTVSYSYTLLDNEFHTQPGNDTSLGESFDVVLVDDDDTTLTKSLDVTVADDNPTLTSVQSAVVENSADAPDFLGTSTLLMGADQPGHADLTANIAGWDGVDTTWGVSTLTSGEHPIYYFVDPDHTDVLYAYTWTSADPEVGPYDPATSDLIFTLRYGVDGNYTLDMDGTIDAPKHIYTDTFNENIGGNFDYLLLASDGTLYKPTDTLPVGTNIVMTIDSSGSSTVNSSNQGLGISNGWITSAEDLILKFTNPVVSAEFSIDTQSGDANNVVTWTVHGMAADGTLTTQSGTTTFTDGVLTKIPTDLTHITQIELSDEAGPGYRVSGTNLVYRIEEEPVSTDLAVAIVDEDGDKASGTLAVTFTPAVEDALVVGSNADDISGSTVPYVTPGDFGVIEGGKGNDILIGDEGRSSLVGKSVNIILMLDTSGSMTDQIAFGSGYTSRIAALRTAVHNLLDELAASHADNVRVDLISFNTSATSLGIFDLKDLTELDAALNTIDHLSAGGNTNYEAALQAALNWVHSTGSDAPLTGANVVNQAIFVSDGEPNSWLYAQNTSLAGSNVRDGLSSTAIAQFLGTYNPSGTSSDDKVSEVALLENLFGPIEAVGINVGTSALDILNQVEGVAPNVVPDAATNITTAEQLDQVLADLNPEVQFSPAGRDTIHGGEGNDILFGDAPFTDDLANAAGLGTADGGGWQVFTELEAHKGQGSYADWDRTDTLNYINTHLDELSQESGRLAGADILDGGAGDDVLFGQEGDDQLIGGTGNDTMSGGSGADTFIWRAADADGSEDVIKDFTIGEDKLDLQEVLDPTSDPLSNYLDISANTDGDAVVKVFKSGDMSADPDLTIVLEGMATDNTELTQLQDYLLHDEGVIK